MMADGAGHRSRRHRARRTGKGNDQVRFELGAMWFASGNNRHRPLARVGSGNRAPTASSYAKAHGIPVTATAQKPYSMDRNLLHISYEGGILEDPWAEPPRDMFLLTRDPEDAVAEASTWRSAFRRATQCGVNGRELGPVELLGELNRIAGRPRDRPGRSGGERFVGMKSRGVYETPGGTLLHRAHRAVES